MSRVVAGARVHFGFHNLSLTHSRLYGGLGAALRSPRVVVDATPADTVDAPSAVETATRRSVDFLGVDGATVSLEESIPRHVGLGSGTQHALATHAAIASAYGRDLDPGLVAPALGRGGRSGVGVATFEAGGFIVDAGHPTERFTTDPPTEGEWTVPPVAARHRLPTDWRFVLVTPTGHRGRSGDTEDRSMRSAVERADPDLADRVAAVVLRRLLPAAAEGDRASFGAAVEEVGRLNGAWYTDEQGGVYRPPVGTLVETLSTDPTVDGAGQSSWGPTAFGVTGVEEADQARRAGRRALDAADVEGTVRVVAPATGGATVDGTSTK